MKTFRVLYLDASDEGRWQDVNAMTIGEAVWKVCQTAGSSYAHFVSASLTSEAIDTANPF